MNKKTTYSFLKEQIFLHEKEIIEANEKSKIATNNSGMHKNTIGATVVLQDIEKNGTGIEKIENRNSMLMTIRGHLERLESQPINSQPNLPHNFSVPLYIPEQPKHLIPNFPHLVFSKPNYPSYPFPIPPLGWPSPTHDLSRYPGSWENNEANCSNTPSSPFSHNLNPATSTPDRLVYPFYRNKEIQAKEVPSPYIPRSDGDGRKTDVSGAKFCSSCGETNQGGRFCSCCGAQFLSV